MTGSVRRVVDRNGDGCSVRDHCDSSQVVVARGGGVEKGLNEQGHSYTDVSG